MTSSFRKAMDSIRQTVPWLEVRSQQEALADAVERTIDDSSILVAQAGTGSGKSYGALIPAILSGERTIYSTATKVLQSQIIDTDLPFLREHLGVKFTYAKLMGRANYVCELEVAKNMATNEIAALINVALSSDETSVQLGGGTREELPWEVDNDTWGELVTSEDNCLRSKCPFYERCFHVRARQEALDADVVVVNHSVVAFDSLTGGALLGPAGVLIVDECHDFAESLTSAGTTRIRPNTFKTFVAEVRNGLNLARTKRDIETAEREAGRISLESGWIFDVFDEGRIRHTKAVERADEVISLRDAVINSVAPLNNLVTDRADDRHKIDRVLVRSVNLSNFLGRWVLDTDRETVRSVRKGGGPLLEIAPLSVVETAQEIIGRFGAVVLMSATALVAGKADFIAAQLGLTNPDVVDVGSPYDLSKQALLYVPTHIPDPKSADWIEHVVPLMGDLVKASNGRALLLFTSYANMNRAWDVLGHSLPYPCRKQGDAPMGKMVQWMRDTEGAVLFATRSFFQGISVMGDNLSLVVIDKLPFPNFTDPLVEARQEAIDLAGGNPFTDYSVPMMALTMVQGLGRLIRSGTDRGVMACFDKRLVRSGYGSKVTATLRVPVADTLDEVDAFFAQQSLDFPRSEKIDA